MSAWPVRSGAERHVELSDPPFGIGATLVRPTPGPLTHLVRSGRGGPFLKRNAVRSTRYQLRAADTRVSPKVTPIIGQNGESRARWWNQSRYLSCHDSCQM